MSWLAQFWVWLQQAFGAVTTRWSRGPRYKTVTVNEALPRQLTKNTLYLVTDEGYEEQAAMLCPCGCGSVLHMNLLPDERPCWSVTQHPNGTASLHPSVWRQVGCRSHFWFRNSRVQWCH